MRDCLQDGCGRPIKAKGRCSRHYQHWRATERTDSDRCTVQDCTKPVLAKGLCSTHYMHQRLYGTPERKRPPFDRHAQRLVLMHLRSGLSLREAAIAAGCNPESVKSMTTQGRNGQRKSTISFAQQVDAILTARTTPKRPSNGLTAEGAAFLAELDRETERDLHQRPGRQQWVNSGVGYYSSR